MNKLVTFRENQVVTTSLQVAETFEKEHRNITQSIEKLTAENSAVKNMFYESTYKNSRGKEYKMYYMNRDGFSLLVMGFTGSKALEFKLDYIKAFNQLEEFYNSPEMIMKRALEIATERAKQAEETLHKLMHSGKLYTASEIAKECGMSAIRLNKFLCAEGVQYKCNGTYLLYEKYQDKDYVSIKQFQRGELTIYDRKFTDKGRLFILELLERRYPAFLETHQPKQLTLSMVLN